MKAAFRIALPIAVFFFFSRSATGSEADFYTAITYPASSKESVKIFLLEESSCVEQLKEVSPASFSQEKWAASYTNLEYGKRRLLSHFSYYIKAVGHGRNLNRKGFCSEYRSLQIRDKSLADASKEIEGLNIWAYGGTHKAWQWEIVEEYGLTEGEHSAILSYSGLVYGQINPLLYAGKPLPPALAIYKDVMDQALMRIPSYTRTPVKRFTNLPEKIAAEHEVGNIVTYAAYTSTSKNLNFNLRDRKYQLLIYGGKNGKDITRVIPDPLGEEEVLFLPGTRFKVIARTGNNITLAEVDETDAIINPAARELERKR